MSCFDVQTDDGITTITMARGKVNAINETFVAECSDRLNRHRHNPETRAIVLTGRGKFFSFGFDIPELYDYTPEAMTSFIRKFCQLYCELYLFPKPVIGALNGHAIAGGCSLALACERRVMVDAGAKIALNEVTFGASLFAGAVAMLRHAVGTANAETFLLSGKMYSPQEALQIGLAERLVPEGDLLASAYSMARELAPNAGPHYASLKRLVRAPIADQFLLREEQSIREWIDIWYSPETREKAKSIRIR